MSRNPIAQRLGDCRIEGTLFPKDQAGVMDFVLQVAWLSSTSVIESKGGIATGALHAEFEHTPTGERHLLDGPCALPAGLSDSSIGL